MDRYQQEVGRELSAWKKQMRRNPSFFNNLSKKVQTKINSWIPEKVHNAITVALKQMIRGVLFGAKHTTSDPMRNASLEVREQLVSKKIDVYRKTAAIEGGITGAGGLLLGLADFPILIGIKIKLLFDIAALYGFDVDDYKERVYILHIFELAFSSHEHRRNVFEKIVDWDEKSKNLPADIHQFDWRNFQQEYRDYIDLAKMAQLIPAIGAPVGLIVNNRLVQKLGTTAMNAYRMRLIK
jgi:EcsC protein family